MALLIINDNEYALRLSEFILQCKACGSRDVELEIDWAAYPSCSWCRVTTICKTCHIDEDIYGT